MADSLSVDTDLAQALVNELAALADSAQQDLTRLKDTLQREGAAWGNDETATAHRLSSTQTGHHRAVAALRHATTPSLTM
jgi:hypothetical protein